MLTLHDRRIRRVDLVLAPDKLTGTKHFVHLDRWVYGPTCALLGSLTATSLLR